MIGADRSANQPRLGGRARQPRVTRTVPELERALGIACGTITGMALREDRRRAGYVSDARADFMAAMVGAVRNDRTMIGPEIDVDWDSARGDGETW